jgi:hypothetical protein
MLPCGRVNDCQRRRVISVIEWLKHAFAVESKFSPSAEELALAERLCREIVRRELALPALAFLEMSRPLNSLGAQALHYFTPILSTVFDSGQCARMAEFLDRRGSIDWLCERLEELTKK